ncbi:MAG: phosphoribosyl-AMP cyclohydrolase [Pseudomonadota bacterium]
MGTEDLPAIAWNRDGLVSAIAQDVGTGEVLMLAWMNAESLTETIRTGDVTYWSRSRQELWRKGATSGHTQRLVELRIDCDRDCILLLIEQKGAACHTGRRTCFYTALRDGDEVELMGPMV